jgi:hypothetical protein
VKKVHHSKRDCSSNDVRTANYNLSSYKLCGDGLMVGLSYDIRQVIFNIS